jgi:hypothetical protein
MMGMRGRREVGEEFQWMVLRCFGVVSVVAAEKIDES